MKKRFALALFMMMLALAAASPHRAVGDDRSKVRQAAFTGLRAPFPLTVKKVILPEGGVWVGKDFEVNVQLEGDKEALKSLALLSLAMDDPNTDYAIGSMIKGISNPSGNVTFTFKDLKVKAGKPAATYKTKIVGLKKGHPPLHHDDVYKYLIVFHQGTIDVQNDGPSDTEAPELLSFAHRCDDNVVRLVVRAKDETAVKSVSAYCMVQLPKNQWSGGFMDFVYEAASDQWVLECALDGQKKLAFKVMGSVGLEDTMNNYAITNVSKEPVVYEYK